MTKTQSHEQIVFSLHGSQSMSRAVYRKFQQDQRHPQVSDPFIASVDSVSEKDKFQ